MTSEEEIDGIVRRLRMGNASRRTQEEAAEVVGELRSVVADLQSALAAHHAARAGGWDE